jgi:hypothetical protein
MPDADVAAAAALFAGVIRRRRSPAENPRRSRNSFKTAFTTAVNGGAGSRWRMLGIEGRLDVVADW